LYNFIYRVEKYLLTAFVELYITCGQAQIEEKRLLSLVKNSTLTAVNMPSLYIFWIKG